MKTHHSCFLGGFSLFSLLVLSSGNLAAEGSFAWSPVKIGDQDYVDLDQVKEFYRFPKSDRTGPDIELSNSTVSLRLKAGSTESKLNGMKVMLDSPVLENDGKLLISRGDLSGVLEPTLRPYRASNTRKFQTVIIDPVPAGPSEGGKDPTLAISTAVLKQLKEQGFDVILTRDSDAPAAVDRTATANTMTDGAIFISITLGGPSEAGRGVATSAVNGSGQGCVPLAVSIHGAVTRKLGKNTADRGMRRVDDGTLGSITHPVVTIQVGSPADAYESKLLNSPPYHEAVAKGICDGIGKYHIATKAASSVE
ncbi:MAG: N-acetylmuramoyl-L-alanine amidase [Verrucomicrobiaceae bacterium]|nr:MAG: N-acetylmuramoyl-L-alanine amidase [Verrucomicrobiaceae bacterium]